MNKLYLTFIQRAFSNFKQITIRDFLTFSSFIGATCRSVYGPYDPFLATSLAQVQQAVAVGGHHQVTGISDPRIQANIFRRKTFVGLFRIPL